MKTKIIISLVSLLFFSQKMIGQIDNSLFDEISVEQETQNLLPSSMIFTQRLLWGEKGLIRTTKILPLNIKNREKELKIRRRMLKAHQVIGYATLAGMVAQGILGTKQYNGQYKLYKTHKMIGNITTASYFIEFGIAISPRVIKTNVVIFFFIRLDRYIVFNFNYCVGYISLDL